jgi:DNA-binding response OmpR family regulator
MTPPNERRDNLKKLLVVEDEPTLRATLQYNLEREGFDVLTAARGDSGLKLAQEEKPDILLLDIMLPDMSGLELCRIIRRESTTPILMLTARAEEMDKVVGLELGADDYVTKPFSMRELIARIHALLRRSELAPAGDANNLSIDGVRVDLRRRTVTRDGQEINLKPKEFELLAYLLRNRGRAVGREELLHQVWGYEFDGDNRTIDVHMSWLRHKIEPVPEKPAHLITIRGLGYRLD